MEPENRFTRCLLEQKNEESRQARNRRRRSILIAILIQLLVLGLLLLRPLFGAPAADFAVARFLPHPPWKGSPGPHTRDKPEPPAGRRKPFVLPSFYVCILRPPPAIRDVPTDLAPEIGPATDGPQGPGFGDPNGLLDNPGLPGVGMPPALPPPPHHDPPPPRAPRIVPPEIQEALLVTRIQPVYPVLAKQIHLEGTVLIRAVIATDGRVESAEVLNGNPLLVRAALDAIVQWRYRPTLLNGQPVEVETLITVIFKLR